FYLIFHHKLNNSLFKLITGKSFQSPALTELVESTLPFCLKCEIVVNAQSKAEIRALQARLLQLAMGSRIKRYIFFTKKKQIKR
ncbi:hypothetical protein R0J90_19485, partial [Micrococcus sp. SIMBA_144]